MAACGLRSARLGEAAGSPPGLHRRHTAHTDSGSATITPLARALNYPMLKGYALAGDFEGVLTVALGLQAPTSIRVGELAGRLYIDLKA